MNQTSTYTGGCHCGKVRYEVTTDLARLGDCNCSHCSAKGFVLSFVPAAQFTLLSGEDALTEYRFHKKVIQHLFCSTCGVQSFASGEHGGEMMYMVNVRCLDGVELAGREIAHFDGRSA